MEVLLPAQPIGEEALDRRKRELTDLARGHALRRSERGRPAPTHVSIQARILYLLWPRLATSIGEGADQSVEHTGGDQRERVYRH
jgi:hypothetical protein